MTTTATEYPFPAPTAEQVAEAAALRERDARLRKASAESWERSDTDGFLSQWASETRAHECEARARILDQGGYSVFQALFTADGDLIADARNVETQYGRAWVYDTADGGAVWFHPSKAQDETKRAANNRKKGYYIGTILAPAAARLSGGGKGLSGCLTVGVEVYRTTQGGSGVIVVDNGR